MRIILTIKAVLNYLKTHLIDLVWVKVLRFSDGTEMDTVPAGNNLYDIKLLSQAIADKGFACMSHTTRQDLNKADVPTLYNDILDKYNNVEKGELPWTQGVGYNGNIDSHNGNVYCFNSNDRRIEISNNPQNTNFTTFKQFNNGFTISGCFTNFMIIINSSGIVAVSYENGDYTTITYTTTNGPYTKDIYLKEIGDYIYVIDEDDNKILRIPNVPFSQITANSIEEVIDCSSFNSGTISDMIYDSTNSMWYLTSVVNRNAGYCHKTTDLGNIDSYTLKIWQTDDWSRARYKLRITQYNNRICLFTSWATDQQHIDRQRIWCTDDYFATVSYTDYNSGLDSDESNYICKDNIVYISGGCYYYDSWGNYRSYPELDLVNVATLTATVETFGYYRNDGENVGGATRIVFSDNDLFYIGYKDKTTSVVAIHYSGLAPITYTDTYQINGSSVAINYYKFNDWKICIPDVSNDTNLDTVYNFLGYLNYWRLDTTVGAETVSIPRDKRLWSMMFVGDNFQDDNLPTGNYVLPVSYIVEKYDDGNGNGYELYNDNKIEIYGVHNFNSSEYSATISVTLPKTMKDNKYNISIDCGRNTDNACAMGYGTKNKTTTGFDVQILQIGSSDYCDYVLWSVKGYIANS